MNQTNPVQGLQGIELMKNNVSKNNTITANIPDASTNILPGFEDAEAKQMQDITDDEIDIQKELEAKFDELFGSD